MERTRPHAHLRLEEISIIKTVETERERQRRCPHRANEKLPLESEVTVNTAFKSATEVYLDLRAVCQRAEEQDTDWSLNKENMARITDVLVQNARPAVAAAPKVLVPEAVMEAWERVFEEAAVDGDVSLVAADGEEVWAHGHILKASSPVLRAMLRTPLREGQTRRIELPGEPAAAVRALVGLMYTGSLAGDENEALKDTGILLDVCRLCHRWQLPALAGLLEARLATRVTQENIEALLEAAVLHGSAELKRACLGKAENDTALEARVRRGQVPPAIAPELRRLFGLETSASSSEAKNKRPRTLI